MRIAASASFLLLLLGLANACAPAGESAGLGGVDIDSSGKADDGTEPAIEEVLVSEELYSNALRRQACDAIAGAHDWPSAAARDDFQRGCLDHEFTVTEKRVSTLFGHLDSGDPVTLGMTVEVTDGSDQWTAQLSRQWQAETYRFRWEARVDRAGPSRDDYLRSLARELGEWPEPEPGDARLASTQLDALPSVIRGAAEARAAEISSDGGGLVATLAEDFLPLEVRDDRGIAGYIVPLEYYEDHVLFDGGGAFLYINLAGDIVAETEWFG